MVERLLGPGRSLASYGSWADDVRGARPETYNWHFVDLPLGADDYNSARDCKADLAHGDCVLAEIDRARNDLTCGSNKNLKEEALKFLVHFVGDVHQPLHTIGEEKGGNLVKVTLAMQGLTCTAHCTPHFDNTNLHAAWDSGLILKTVWNWGAYVERLETGFLRTASAQGLEAGTPIDWTLETHRAGKAVWDAVPADKVLTDDYFNLALPILDRQLAAAGLRLARLLNEAGAAPVCGAQ